MATRDATTAERRQHRDIREDELIVVAPATAWVLVGVGVISQGVASWLKRSRWR